MSRRSETRTGLWVLGDQVASSGTSFGGSALAAGLLSAGDFGAWSIAFTVYVLLLSGLRTWCGDTLMLLLPVEQHGARLVGGALALAMTVGTATGVGALAIGIVPDGTTGSALRALGACLPGLLLQDATRMSLLAARNARAAFLSDGSWLVLTTVSLMALRLTDTASTTLAMLAWGLPAYVGAVVGLRQLGTMPSLPLLSSWIQRTRRLSVLISAEFVVFALSSLLMLQLVLSSAGDVEAVGSVRGAQVLMGPVLVFLAASTTYSLPLMARAFAVGDPYVTLGARQSSANAVAAAIGFLVASLVPANIGVRVFGATWEGALDQLPAVAMSVAAAGISSGAIGVLRSSGRVSTSLVAHIALAILVGGTTVATALRFSSETVIWAFALSSLLGPAVLWSAAVRGRRHATTSGG